MKKFLIFLAIAAVVAAAGYALWQFIFDVEEIEPEERITEELDTRQTTLEERFVEAFYDQEYANATLLEEPPEITGDEAADRQIRLLAEDRGYRLQRVPDNGLEEIQGVSVQPELVQAWESLQAAAIEEGVYLGLVSGYRSVDDQREIFLTQLRDRAIEVNGVGYSDRQIAEGEADEVIDEILEEYSIPGYSKHHSGYIIDITDTSSDRPFEEFAETPGYTWVEADDYANMRAFGFVPSYPEGVDDLGPEPEPWEYAWIGDGAEDL